MVSVMFEMFSNPMLGDLVAKIATLPEEQRKEIEADIEASG